MNHVNRTETYDVVVVGGGLAGLAAGATAAAAGASTIVLERHRPGGRARTTERDGFLFNQGGHALYVGGPGMAVLESLGVRPAGSPPPLRRYRLLAGGTLHQMPSGLTSPVRTTAAGPRGRLQLTRFLAGVPRLRASGLRGRSVRQWLAGLELRPDAEAVVRALLRLTTYVADVDEFGADVAAEQLRVSRRGVLYLHGGWSQLVEALAGQVQVRSGTAVRAVEAVAGRVEVRTDGPSIVARAAVVAPGTPVAARALLPLAPAWPGLGEAVTAACLDVGARQVPSPEYVIGLDAPVYGSTQSPPARLAPEGGAVVSVVRYGARSAAEDRPELDAHLGVLGVGAEHVVTSRFLARMVVAAALPRAAAGGLAGRPAITDSGTAGVYLAGDWVGALGWLADASLASGQAAAVQALRMLGLATY
jgi:phytoene dehydrogenase-like protein